jgi:hypothetical protein
MRAVVDTEEAEVEVEAILSTSAAAVLQHPPNRENDHALLTAKN